MPIFRDDFRLVHAEAIYLWAAFTTQFPRVISNPDVSEKEETGLVQAYREFAERPHKIRDVVNAGSVEITRGGHLVAEVDLPSSWKHALANLADLGISRVPIFEDSAEGFLRAGLSGLKTALAAPNRRDDDRLTVGEANFLEKFLIDRGFEVKAGENPRPEKLGPRFPDDPKTTRRLYDLPSVDKDGNSVERSSAEMFREVGEEADKAREGRDRDDRDANRDRDVRTGRP